MERVCENCACEDDDLIAVVRVYPTDTALTDAACPTDAASEEMTEVGGDPELWCFSCRSLYPHRLAEPSP